VITNVVGTSNVLRCAHAAGVKRFILISTDKAASKHSVMGCTKRLCEQLVLAYRGPMVTWAVRFGNVVGSRGSVVPLFERQIEALLAPEEGWRPTDHPSIREVISPGIAKEEDLAWIVERLERLAREGNAAELVRALKTAVQGPAPAPEEPAAEDAIDTRSREQENA